MYLNLFLSCVISTNARSLFFLKVNAKQISQDNFNLEFQLSSRSNEYFKKEYIERIINQNEASKSSVQQSILMNFIRRTLKVNLKVFEAETNEGRLVSGG